MLVHRYRWMNEQSTSWLAEVHRVRSRAALRRNSRSSIRPAGALEPGRTVTSLRKPWACTVTTSYVPSTLLGKVSGNSKNLTETTLLAIASKLFRAKAASFDTLSAAWPETTSIFAFPLEKVTIFFVGLRGVPTW